jgi:ADP-ribose pyrophosphatase
VRAGLRLLGERLIADGSFLQISRRHFLASEGRSARREIIRHPGAVAVVPLIGGEVVLISQYRVAVDQELLEIPAGKRDEPGEDPETTAIRECEEEVGYRPSRVTLLHTFYTTPGFTDECIWLYLAHGLEPVPSRPRGIEEERAEVVRLPVREALRKVRDGEIRDAKTLIGLLALEKEWTA